jgi:hypothetical protein
MQRNGFRPWGYPTTDRSHDYYSILDESPTLCSSLICSIHCQPTRYKYLCWRLCRSQYQAHIQCCLLANQSSGFIHRVRVGFATKTRFSPTIVLGLHVLTPQSGSTVKQPVGIHLKWDCVLCQLSVVILRIPWFWANVVLRYAP